MGWDVGGVNCVWGESGVYAGYGLCVLLFQ